MARKAVKDPVTGYPVASIILHRGSWHDTCTIPPELRPYLGDKKQLQMNLRTECEESAKELRSKVQAHFHHQFDLATAKKLEIETHLEHLKQTFEELR